VKTSPILFSERMIVAALDLACRVIDKVLYSPFVVRALRSMPWFWHCQLANVSIRLDDRWSTGHWLGAFPDGLCEACQRRAAIFVIGSNDLEDDLEEDLEDDLEQSSSTTNPIRICGYCKLAVPISSPEDREREILAARRRSRQ
jgi:hypothetical protein